MLKTDRSSSLSRVTFKLRKSRYRAIPQESLGKLFTRTAADAKWKQQGRVGEELNRVSADGRRLDGRVSKIGARQPRLEIFRAALWEMSREMRFAAATLAFHSMILVILVTRARGKLRAKP